jgi:hypothetical protein
MSEKPDFDQISHTVLQRMDNEIYWLEYSAGELKFAANIISTTLIEAWNMGRESGITERQQSGCSIDRLAHDLGYMLRACLELLPR